MLTGSAGSGKSSALRELSARRNDLALFDLDDLRPPPEAGQSWWRRQIDARVALAVTEQMSGTDTVVAGWLTRREVLAAPAAAALEGVAVCLIDCDDAVRVSRIEARAASGMWRLHTPGEIEGFLRAAAEMRTSGDSLLRLDTSTLSVSEVADRLEEWMDRIKSGRS